MALQSISILDVTPLQENWDASLQSLIASMKTLLYSLAMAIDVQGDHTTPSFINIQACDLEGNAVPGLFLVRIRICDSGAYAVATNAYFSVIGGDLVEYNSISKDMIVRSNSSGLIQLQCTDTTIETFTVRTGPPDFQSDFVLYNNTLSVVHA